MTTSVPNRGFEETQGVCPPVTNIVLLAASVVVACLIGRHLSAGSGNVAALWLANGLTLGVLLVNPVRLWPVYLGVGYLANISVGLTLGTTPAVTALLGLANITEILVAAALIYRPNRPSRHFTDRTSALRMGAGFLLGPAVSMVIAGISREMLIGAPFVQTAQIWYLAHAVGLTIVTPLTLTLLFRDFEPILAAKALPRTVAILLLLLIDVTLVFHQTQYPLLFFIFPPLALVVFQLGFPGMTIGLFSVAVEASFFTVSGSGPFMLMHASSSSERVVMEQLFLLTCVAMAEPIAIALTERRLLEQRLRAAQEQLRQLAATDQLTGISNRRMFDEFLDREWKRAARDKSELCAIMIDVDNFKSYNDRYGHQAGDECLKAVASGLAEVVRRPGDLVARYGGEEFVVLLPHTHVEGGRFVADQIRRRIESLQIVHAGSAHGRVTISLGVGIGTPANGGRADAMIVAADTLLYAAKHNGRNCVMTEAEAQALRETAIA